MTPQAAPSPEPVRQRLRKATHDCHMALHRHPLMAPLVQADLSMAQLNATAQVTCLAASAVEAERAALDLWPELSLRMQERALRRDLGAVLAPPVSLQKLPLAGRGALLGALYVIHGSSFGAAAIAKSVSKVLPGTPRSFFPTCSVSTWRFLCEELEGLSEHEAEQAEAGALAAFAFYRRLADWVLSETCSAAEIALQNPSRTNSTNISAGLTRLA